MIKNTLTYSCVDKEDFVKYGGVSGYVETETLEDNNWRYDGLSKSMHIKTLVGFSAYLRTPVVYLNAGDVIEIEAFIRNTEESTSSAVILIEKSDLESFYPYTTPFTLNVEKRSFFKKESQRFVVTVDGYYRVVLGHNSASSGELFIRNAQFRFHRSKSKSIKQRESRLFCIEKVYQQPAWNFKGNFPNDIATISTNGSLMTITLSEKMSSMAFVSSTLSMSSNYFGYLLQPKNFFGTILELILVDRNTFTAVNFADVPLNYGLTFTINVIGAYREDIIN